MLIFRRQKEAEQKSIQDEANKRIEEMVSKRVEEELERRRDEIEAEVLRRVEEAKKVLEAQMLEEMEKRKQEQLEEAKRREVRILSIQNKLEKHPYSISITIPRHFHLENHYKAEANILFFKILLNIVLKLSLKNRTQVLQYLIM